MSEREAFEKWYAENKGNDWLWRMNKVDAFHIWQASRRSALEEAAKLCESAGFNPAGQVADEIRALSAPAKGE